MDDNLLIALVSIFITILGIFITFLFYILPTKSQNKSLDTENKTLLSDKMSLEQELRKLKTDNYNLNEIITKLKCKLTDMSISADPSKERFLVNDSRLIEIATHCWSNVKEIYIIGINSIGVIHQCMEDFKELIEKGTYIKILLLNPKSKEFNDRIKSHECVSDINKEEYEIHRTRLLSEWNATIAILKCIFKSLQINKEFLQVRLRSEKPTFAMTATISDQDTECCALINEYPPKGRGISHGQIIAHKHIPNQAREFLERIKMFNKSWNKSIVFKLIS